MIQTERRTIQAAELRAIKQDEQPSKIIGYAALYNSLSEVMWGCVQEKIAQGAFAGVIPKSDIRCLFNHDANFVLGRMAAGTLNVTDDAKGLYFENTPPNTSIANDLMVSIDRGDVNQCSFAFTVADDGDDWDETADGMILRTINVFDELFDVSPVTYPAFTDTNAQVRSLCREKNLDFEQLNSIVIKQKRGVVLSDKEKDFIKRSFQVAKEPIIPPEQNKQAEETRRRLFFMRQRLNIVEKSI